VKEREKIETNDLQMVWCKTIRSTAIDEPNKITLYSYFLNMIEYISGFIYRVYK
jgi:hypothetical protein